MSERKGFEDVEWEPCPPTKASGVFSAMAFSGAMFLSGILVFHVVYHIVVYLAGRGVL